MAGEYKKFKIGQEVVFVNPRQMDWEGSRYDERLSLGQIYTIIDVDCGAAGHGSHSAIKLNGHEYWMSSNHFESYEIYTHTSDMFTSQVEER